jgi:outer membrane protein
MSNTEKLHIEKDLKEKAVGMKRYQTALMSLAFLALSCIAASAETTFGLGAIFVPQFESSSDFTTRIAPNFSFKNDEISLRSSGPGLEADLLSSRALDAGPILRYNFGRTGSNIDNAQVSALPDIEGGIELGGYVQLNFPVGGLNTFLSPRISFVQGVQGGATGTQVEASVGLLRLQGDWTLGSRASATYANADYMTTNFGVGAGSASGLAPFNAGSGIKDVGLSLFANYKINEQLSITGVTGYKVLMNDAADSPIVSVAGSSEYIFASAGINFGF